MDPEIFSNKTYAKNGKHSEYNVQRPGTTTIHFKNVPDSNLD